MERDVNTEADPVSSAVESFDEMTIAQGERWPPLGAAREDPEIMDSTYSVDSDYWPSDYCSAVDSERLYLLEEEQEQLNMSLMALTSHFAQVQFRLKQIVDADADSKERLLRELEEFAFRGIPDFQKSMRCVEGAQFVDEQDHSQKMEAHRVKQQELIKELKQQLEDLECYAYETGEAGMPQTLVVERQRVIIDQMKNKLALNLDELDKLSLDELRQQVDMAIGQLVNPLKMKEQLVSQLKTQITDLERFIEFLQGPGGENPSAANGPCVCPVHMQSNMPKATNSARSSHQPSAQSQQVSDQDKIQQTLRRMSHLLQIYIISQFGCGVGRNASPYSQDMPSASTGEKLKPFRAMKARLEGGVGHVLRAASVGHKEVPMSSWDPEDQAEVIKAVRKVFCPVLRDLMAHGLIQPGSSSVSLVPFLSCAATPRPPAAASGQIHPWQLLVAYFRTKDGPSLMSNPQRSLAQSFSLEIQGGTSKQSLLVAIGNILATHGPYKRSAEAHFKAFISSALNSKKLVPWLRIVYRSPSLIEEFYESWSYAVQTGFDDSWKALEQLQAINFDLPEDLSIRSLRNMFDAF